jgi:hypothetical protein
MSMREEELQGLWREFCASGGSDVRDLFETIPALTQPQQRIYLLARAFAQIYGDEVLRSLLNEYKALQAQNRSSMHFRKHLESRSLHEFMKQQQKAQLRGPQ